MARRKGRMGTDTISIEIGSMQRRVQINVIVRIRAVGRIVLQQGLTDSTVLLLELGSGQCSGVLFVSRAAGRCRSGDTGGPARPPGVGARAVLLPVDFNLGNGAGQQLILHRVDERTTDVEGEMPIHRQPPPALFPNLSLAPAVSASPTTWPFDLRPVAGISSVT